MSQTGTGTACTPGSPCALATANSMVRAGDVVRLAPGTYLVAPSPTVDGTPNARITYVGNLAIPDAVVIASGMTLNRMYITVKGMSFTSGVYLDRRTTTACARFDSLAYLNIYHTLGVDQAKDCMVYKVNVTSGLGRFTMSTPATPVADWTTPERDTVRRCTFHLGEQVTDGYHVVQIRGATNCVIDSNQVNIQMAPGLVNEINPFIAFYMRYCQFKDNRWRIKNTDINYSQMMRWRDSSMYNRVYRDTIIMFGSGTCRFAPSSAGSYVGTTTQNYFDGLVIKCSTNPSDYALYYQNGMRRDTLVNCVVIDSIGKAFTNSQVEKGTSLIDHCTFVGNSNNSVAEVSAGVDQWGPEWASDGALVFTNNIIAQSTPGSNDSGMGWEFSSAGDQLTSNGNLYFMAGKPSGHAILWSVTGAGARLSAPGPGTPWATTFGRDINSYWGSPMFVDSTFTNFDARLGPGSYAAGRALDGSDIGARRMVGPDNTAPATVGNLNTTEVNDNSLWLSWTAPGDDGSIGLLSGYDLRYSTSPITAANFSSATPVSPQPPPAVAGTLQAYLVLGLSPGVSYYFALKARDEVNNWSGLSNVKQVATATTDTRPPASVRDLTAAP